MKTSGEMRAQAATLIAVAEILDRLSDLPTPQEFAVGHTPCWFGWRMGKGVAPRVDVIFDPATGCGSVELWDDQLLKRVDVSIKDVAAIAAFVRRHAGHLTNGSTPKIAPKASDTIHNVDGRSECSTCRVPFAFHGAPPSTNHVFSTGREHAVAPLSDAALDAIAAKVYPADPRGTCPGCGRKAIDGKRTCGDARCGRTTP